jgi:broad specificity phosphatase PhoE
MGWDDDYAGLNDLGVEDAKITASKLAQYHIDAVYHSDLIRTSETASIIANQLQLVSLPTTSLRERNLGNFSGFTMHEIKVSRPHDWDKFLDHADVDWNGLGGESLRDVHNRFDKFIKVLHTKHRDQTVLLISHSGFMHTILRDYFGFFPTDSFIEVGHSSITVLEKFSSKYNLALHNA